MLNKQKYLGQHFLKNKKILEEMARAGEISKKDTVLEVGPGLGPLTKILAERAGKVIAVEKDLNLVALLMKHETLSKNKNVKIIYGDILKPETWLSKVNALGFMFHASHFKIIANIPYYITSRFLRIFLSNPKLKPKLMVLMVQKEVAERICAKPPRMNLLALSVQAYAKPEIIRRVSKNFFSPPPKIDSAIIKISLRRPTSKLSKLEQILAVAKLAFQQKRKMLRHSLKHTIWNLKHDSGFMLYDPRFRKRPEELSLEDWAEIVVK